ncbi:MAG TPA: sigma 54-interacting transcriptional regulator [Kiritimatiellia bacterium]|nr:sigma 54-interacting transcriptional regulator [Kiritimatiellia bacterium]HRZ13175.1 sigma 54-interacting transcriptional regulator [Kiritimatiellia bacterium]HSA17596.1 sigma 54-interacting transcriptional regulator [Kiritimatiellia bacterium]
MKQSLRIPASDQPLFRLVEAAAVANPFSDDRFEVERKIAGAAGGTAAPIRERAIQKVRERVAGYVRRGRADIRLYPREDAQRLRTVILFDVFHRHIQELDGLIVRQQEAGDAPIEVPFAGTILQEMTDAGLTLDASRHVLAEFYQLRRAFYFIRHAALGSSPCMQALRCELWTNVFTHDFNLYDRFLWDRMEDFSTLLLGETGTGKGMAARAIGCSGFIPYDPVKGRFACSFTRTFISLNLSQFPPSLIESELFGHRKGAFTGAIEEHTGLLARCSPHGAIFLDEIGDVDIPIQIKLLQVLQERTFSPVGSHEKKRFQGRVIAATNKPLEQLRRSGRFRDDFYYRLCSDQITLPPLAQRLRENPSELGDLVGAILQRLCGKSFPELKAVVLAALERSPGPNYAWPGNVRELEQATRRILLKAGYEGDAKRADGGAEPELLEGIRAGTADAASLLSMYCKVLYERHGTYEEVARRTGLDWRTAKKHIAAVP